MKSIDDLLGSLLADEAGASDYDLERLRNFLVQTFSDYIRTSETRIVDSSVDRTGAVPGIYCKLAGVDQSQSLGVEWHALLSLNGYDKEGGNRGVNCCVHVVIYIQKSRVKTDRGTVIRYSLVQEDGKWQWRCQGWVEDEYDEFDDETPPSG